ncbi:uncharacterized protein MONBRDRAFT_11054 [Monosiga brevicollis MX1]|uniref:Uncharacterized protein n=1 Tax=Monosiga brevicollis TaxID=81824 RepID=A9V828_MONBE|nr:uncharacterized protein MONBRDRAFT_11054 [Monosiga brevicollis MX1]EDQ86267.1 predicted protein [Monosiga brevicollis MX1]|eukprot:XP_001748937.1 hypothetical protein [Monosiga brevicollis MX1]
MTTTITHNPGRHRRRSKAKRRSHQALSLCPSAAVFTKRMTTTTTNNNNNDDDDDDDDDDDERRGRQGPYLISQSAPGKRRRRGKPRSRGTGVERREGPFDLGKKKQQVGDPGREGGGRKKPSQNNRRGGGKSATRDEKLARSVDGKTQRQRSTDEMRGLVAFGLMVMLAWACHASQQEEACASCSARNDEGRTCRRTAVLVEPTRRTSTSISCGSWYPRVTGIALYAYNASYEATSYRVEVVASNPTLIIWNTTLHGTSADGCLFDTGSITSPTTSNLEVRFINIGNEPALFYFGLTQTCVANRSEPYFPPTTPAPPTPPPTLAPGTCSQDAGPYCAMQADCLGLTCRLPVPSFEAVDIILRFQTCDASDLHLTVNAQDVYSPEKWDMGTARTGTVISVPTALQSPHFRIHDLDMDNLNQLTLTLNASSTMVGDLDIPTLHTRIASDTCARTTPPPNTRSKKVDACCCRHRWSCHWHLPAPLPPCRCGPLFSCPLASPPCRSCLRRVRTCSSQLARRKSSFGLGPARVNPCLMDRSQQTDVSSFFCELIDLASQTL